MQVNMMYHPDAFNSLEEAFDPSTNVSWAASWLKKLTHIPAKIIVVIVSSPIIFYARFPRIGLRQQYCSQIKRF